MACKEFDCGYPDGECSGACAKAKPACGTGILCRHEPECADVHCPGRGVQASEESHVAWISVALVAVILGTVFLASGAADGWLIALVSP